MFVLGVFYDLDAKGEGIPHHSAQIEISFRHRFLYIVIVPMQRLKMTVA
jgi:hypothetical protein